MSYKDVNGHEFKEGDLAGTVIDDPSSITGKMYFARVLIIDPRTNTLRPFPDADGSQIGDDLIEEALKNGTATYQGTIGKAGVESHLRFIDPAEEFAKEDAAEGRTEA